MIIKLNNASNFLLESLIDKLKLKLPEDYEIKFNNRKNRESIYVRIDSRYNVNIKLKGNDIIVNYDLTGCLVLFLPEYIFLLFQPKARKYERDISEILIQHLKQSEYDISVIQN